MVNRQKGMKEKRTLLRILTKTKNRASQSYKIPIIL